MRNPEALQQDIGLFQQLIDNKGNVPGLPLGMSTTDYAIKDFNVNRLPEKNAMQRVIDDYVQNRHNFLANKNNRGSSSCSERSAEIKKPKLEDFLKAFSNQVTSVNKTYKASKQEFLDMMRALDKEDDSAVCDEASTSRWQPIREKLAADAVIPDEGNPMSNISY